MILGGKDTTFFTHGNSMRELRIQSLNQGSGFGKLNHRDKYAAEERAGGEVPPA